MSSKKRQIPIAKPQGNPTNDRLIGQLAGCGTSVGANYCEADERVSRKDFRTVIGRCAKEAKETKHFLRMVAVAEPSLAAEARELFREARELHLIFAAIYKKMNLSNMRNDCLKLEVSLVLGVWCLGFLS